jgi:hypothetical protein
MKADRKFSRYSEQEWGLIAAVIVRLLPSAAMTGLRERLERLGRVYVSMPRMNPDALKFFTTKAEQVAEFRRQMMDGGRLPPELRQRARDVLHEIEEHYQGQLDQLGHDYGLRTTSVDILLSDSIVLGSDDCRVIYSKSKDGYWRTRYKIPRKQNAQLVILDCYFDDLRHEWMRTSGDWPEGSANTKPIRTFIAACAEPVVGAKSSSERAISDRLYRLYKRRRDRCDEIADDFTYAVECRWRQELNADEQRQP